ncbi:hypothetical protein NQ318_004315 [Aromia moschata]|uniref:Transcription factor Adf-1 n=1 Tax=Aromia moschata TaxID=1265417 RepID=A0AAV8YQN5_9CUCU|nr:hypothetical protein NQ318_004315 [Aromia moschata]
MEDLTNIRFVQVVEKYSVLYDHSDDNYSNRHAQEMAWNLVGTEMNQSGSVCKEKWKNIRSAYTRYLRQKSDSNTSVKKRYYLAEYLNFLLPFTKSRSVRNRVYSPPSAGDEGNSFPSDEDGEFEDGKFQAVSIKWEECNENRDSDNENRDEASANKISQNEHTEKRKEVDPLDTCQPHAVDHFSFSAKRRHVENVEDADFLFLKSLLPDVRRMSARQKFEFKYKTMKLIDEILYNLSSATDAFSTETSD